MKLLILKLILFSTPFLEIKAEKSSFNLGEVLIDSQSLTVEERYGDRIELLGIKFKDPLVLCQILIAIFFIITFIQSGLDKVFDRKNNLIFFRDHFSTSPIKRHTSILLTFITLSELICGLVLIYGVYYSFVEKTTLWVFYGFVLCSFNLIVLFSGQRLAKDYAGASDLVPYVILVVIGIMSMY